MHLFAARGLTPAKGQPDADERIETGAFTISELMDMVRKNQIQDAKTLVGLLWLDQGCGQGGQSDLRRNRRVEPRHGRNIFLDN